MRWREPSHRLDRLLAAIEIPALGVWLGALAGFAFVSAPLAFRIVAPHDLARFSELTVATLVRLSTWAAVLGAVAIAAAIGRAVQAADRISEAIRILLVAVALALVAYERFGVIPAMRALGDPGSPAFHALHGRSTVVYGGVLLCVLAALVSAAARRPG
ncbi:MAG: DUF4149 domain-containing protein [Candidatus Eremiobacteraeota bacterium]|nr:DUF4149 domain-containing protein [Candidatus Eremiobacteraeota bacterium]